MWIDAGAMPPGVTTRRERTTTSATAGSLVQAARLVAGLGRVAQRPQDSPVPNALPKAFAGPTSVSVGVVVTNGPPEKMWTVP
jgi:hypothetical protein